MISGDKYTRRKELVDAICEPAHADAIAAFGLSPENFENVKVTLYLTDPSEWMDEVLCAEIIE
jgi:hypothetical protein